MSNAIFDRERKKELGYRQVTVELDVPPVRPAAAVDPAKTVLLVVDLQNESVHPEGAHYRTPEGMEAVHATAALVDKAREQGVKVFWLLSVRRPDQPIFTAYGMELYRLEGSWNAEITPPLRPAEGEPTFKKYTHDIFNNTDFEAHLTEHGITAPEWTFVVTGAAFTGCVYHAVTGLSMRYYRVLVPMDCVSPRTGDGALVAMYRLGHGSYPYNTTLLQDSSGLQFDASIPTDARGLPLD